MNIEDFFIAIQGTKTANSVNDNLIIRMYSITRKIVY